MPSVLASSTLVVPLVPESRLNRSSSVAAASVLKAQKLVANSISGSTEVLGFVAAIALLQIQPSTRRRQSGTPSAPSRPACSARGRLAGYARRNPRAAVGFVGMDQQRILREIQYGAFPRRTIGRPGMLENGEVGASGEPVVEDRAGERDLETKAIDRAKRTGALSGGQEHVDPPIDARRRAPRVGVHGFRALHELAEQQWDDVRIVGDQIDVAADELLEAYRERRRTGEHRRDLVQAGEDVEQDGVVQDLLAGEVLEQ